MEIHSILIKEPSISNTDHNQYLQVLPSLSKLLFPQYLPSHICKNKTYPFLPLLSHIVNCIKLILHTIAGLKNQNFACLEFQLQVHRSKSLSISLPNLSPISYIIIYQDIHNTRQDANICLLLESYN